MDKETANLLSKGREHYAAKDYDKAEAYLVKVVDAGVRFADVFNMLGVIYHGKGQMALAQDNFEKALGLNPGYTEAALNLAVTYNDVGQYVKAKELYSQITSFKKLSKKEMEPVAKGKLANMHAELGRAYMDVGDPEKAIEQFRRALDMCPNYVDIRTQLGQALREAGKVQHFGVSNFTPAQYELLASRLDFPLVTNQVEFSLMHLDPLHDGTFDLCQQRRIAPMAWSPLAGGRLFREESARAARLRRALDMVGDTLAQPVEISEVSLAWILTHPAGVIPVLGSGKLERLQRTAAAANLRLSREAWFALWSASTGHEVP